MDLYDICKDAQAILMSSDHSWINNSYILVFSDRPDLRIYQMSNKVCFSDNNSNLKEINKNPFDVIEHYLDKGYYAIGYIGYDYLECCDINLKLNKKERDNLFPQLYFNFYKPHKLMSFKKNHADTINMASLNNHLVKDNTEIDYSVSKKKYLSNIDQIKRYIEQGDVYQVNLSHLLRSGIDLDPKDIFINYFASQPVPFGIYINFDTFHFLGGSMELFIEKKAETIITKPIKGTSKRDNNPQIDGKRKSDLNTSIKERAENLMIVDLMRNDFSRICKNGTVRVNKLFDVKSYKTLHQMESEVQGELIENIKLKDIIYNVFPPGSVTGAPKKRSIEIIDELESHSRGPYCGCAGVFSPDGDFTLCVSIRTAVIADKSANYWAGSGIVYDSDPQKEYNETLLKAKAFLKTIN